jgi:DNA-directed RNA polymerase subunit RPC12/RpoP
MTTYRCGACGTEFDTNFQPDEVECPECDSRRCESCGHWSGS